MKVTARFIALNRPPKSNGHDRAMDNVSPLIFVYGTLRRKSTSGAHQRFLHNAEFIGDALLRAKLFRVSYYPAMTLTDDNFLVVGEVYALRDEQHLHCLDEYEECATPWHDGQEYRREQVSVTMQDDQRRLSVWTYVYNRPTAGLEHIVSGDFLLRESVDG
jgi:gamma-glutamylcyclotransferase (GGCT)/AIG2-like uncharacterized protein YtfP